MWATCPVLRALAEVRRVDIAVLTPMQGVWLDMVHVYRCGASSVVASSSWRDVRMCRVPRLLRQAEGLVDGRRLVVLVWNGVNHYDAVVA